MQRADSPATSSADALRRLEAWPTTPLASLPTPLLVTRRLAERVGMSPLYVKMDAETGFALGGNKVRKLEFELAPDRLEGVTCLITAGGPQSNHCRVTAAFAARAGLRCILVTQGPEPSTPAGNALLHRLFGAEIVTVADRTQRTPMLETVADEVESDGGHPLVVPIGASTGLGCLGYARAAGELVRQLDASDDGCSRTTLFLSSSSGGTLAGLVLGLAVLGRDDVDLVAVSADAPAGELRATALDIAAEGAALLGAEPDFGIVGLEVVDDQVGEGYGIPTPASRAALEAFGALEGIVLDPTYTAKAAAGMLDWPGRSELPADRRVVFLHTGGAPGLLA